MRVTKRKPHREHQVRTPAYRRLQRRLSTNLREIRGESGLTQQEMATHCGMLVQQYQKIENGKANLTLASVAQLIERLGIDVVDLFAPLKSE